MLAQHDLLPWSTLMGCHDSQSCEHEKWQEQRATESVVEAGASTSYYGLSHCVTGESSPNIVGISPEEAFGT